MKTMIPGTLFYILSAVVLASCASVPGVHNQQEETHKWQRRKADGTPLWINRAPVEKGFVYGIGTDPDQKNAIYKSFVDIAYQIESRIKSTVTKKTSASENELDKVFPSIKEQVRNASLVGAKIFDEYKADDNSYWVLVRMPLDCVIDITQSTLISYSAELEFQDTNVKRLAENIEKDLGNKRIKPSEETLKLEETSKTEETPKTEETLKLEETSKTEETPKAEETSKTKKTPKTKEKSKKTVKLLKDNPLLVRFAWITCTAAALTGAIIYTVNPNDPFNRVVGVISALFAAEAIPFVIWDVSISIRNKKMSSVSIGNTDIGITPTLFPSENNQLNFGFLFEASL